MYGLLSFRSRSLSLLQTFCWSRTPSNFIALEPKDLQCQDRTQIRGLETSSKGNFCSLERVFHRTSDTRFQSVFLGP
jgi:hypothetical protein